VHQVIYSSAAVSLFSETELARLLANARSNNERLGVTGLLLYDDGSFLQVLEGEQQVIDTLYETIARDKRHNRIVALLRRDVSARHFGQWRMGFASMSVVSKKLPGYAEYRQAVSEPGTAGSAAAQLLGAFREGRFRSFVGT
jgi:FAD-dependent sensor of blue light